MFCVNTFWFRNTDTSPGKEGGNIYQRRKRAQQASLGSGSQNWVSSTMGLKESWTRPTPEPCQMGLDRERLSCGRLLNWQLGGCDWPSEGTPATGSVGEVISKTESQIWKDACFRTTSVSEPLISQIFTHYLGPILGIPP